MLNLLTKVARFLMQASVVAFTVIGGVMGHAAAGDTGTILGGIAGFCVAAVVFGLAAAVLDMQRSLRILADATVRNAVVVAA